MVNLIGWNFDNSYIDLPKTFYSAVQPGKVAAPEITILNRQLAEELGLKSDELMQPEGIAVLSGNELPDGSASIAQAYAGHQFGHFTMLGDGRAILIGEQITPEKKRVDIQLKGAGVTPYSRGGDGRAALGPMLREYLISEAMNSLGIPTSRSLAVVQTGEDVIREQSLPGAILTRVAESHLRIGTFQYARQWSELDELKALADYSLARHFPEAATRPNRYIELFKEVVTRQAKLIAKWNLVGFVHGVMNTDNMTISGETIDYGPCAFIDQYVPTAVFSSIDRHGRYAYNQQKPVAIWNLARLAEALLPLVEGDKDTVLKQFQALLYYFSDCYQDQWLNGMRGKLGILEPEAEDEALIHQLLEIMEKHKADYTHTFRALTLTDYRDQDWFETEDFKRWEKLWKLRLKKQNQSSGQILQQMKQSNPAIIPRNYLVEQVLEEAVSQDNLVPFKQFLSALQDPYAYSEEQERYAMPAPTDQGNYQTFCGT